MNQDIFLDNLIIEMHEIEKIMHFTHILPKLFQKNTY